LERNVERYWLFVSWFFTWVFEPLFFLCLIFLLPGIIKYGAQNAVERALKSIIQDDLFKDAIRDAVRDALQGEIRDIVTELKEISEKLDDN